MVKNDHVGFKDRNIAVLSDQFGVKNDKLRIKNG